MEMTEVVQVDVAVVVEVVVAEDAAAVSIFLLDCEYASCVPSPPKGCASALWY